LTKVRDLKGDMDGVILSGRIVEKEASTFIETRYGPRAFSKAVLEDDTGRVLLNLFGPQVEMVKEGDFVRVEGGFTKLFQGMLELNVGSRGRITALSGE